MNEDTKMASEEVAFTFIKTFGIILITSPLDGQVLIFQVKVFKNAFKGFCFKELSVKKI